jgi:hypothetical protein
MADLERITGDWQPKNPPSPSVAVPSQARVARPAPTIPREPAPEVPPEDGKYQWSRLTAPQRSRWINAAWDERFADDPEAKGATRRDDLTKAKVAYVLDRVSAGLYPKGIEPRHVGVVLSVADEYGLGTRPIAQPVYPEAHRLSGPLVASLLSLLALFFLAVGVLFFSDPLLHLFPVALVNVPLSWFAGMLTIVIAVLLVGHVWNETHLRLNPEPSK